MELPQHPHELAKQGNPAAIARLINHALQPKGITARVTGKDGTLKVMLEADQIPDQQILVPYLEKNLAKLGITGIETIEIYGKQTCAAVPAWRQTCHCRLSSVSSTARSLPSEPAPPQTSPPEPVSTASTKPATVRLRMGLPNVPSQRTYQMVFTGVIALILILLGANLRSIHTLLASKPSPRPVALVETKEGVYRTRIINRIRGVPVIMVTFNGRYTVPMILDTGASSTVITQSMASTLGIVPIGQAIAQTANGYTTFDVGYVDSIEVEGAKMQQLPVAIGLPDMEVGLLGHDFFGNFDVTVREDRVEFRPRTSPPVKE
ncbi:retropepsin-like aspartic protease family protein [Leptothermofonsia sp. ETS-13]|uniref:retropepsin-like aspartic protease family protein n=1 Tax=Leptothermofonsia sp. ETS-13 TaxID=3035696 RepID=UPI003B9F72CA